MKRKKILNNIATTTYRRLTKKIMIFLYTGALSWSTLLCLHPGILKMLSSFITLFSCYQPFYSKKME